MPLGIVSEAASGKGGDLNLADSIVSPQSNRWPRRPIPGVDYPPTFPGTNRPTTFPDLRPTTVPETGPTTLPGMGYPSNWPNTGGQQDGNTNDKNNDKDNTTTVSEDLGRVVKGFVTGNMDEVGDAIKDLGEKIEDGARARNNREKIDPYWYLRTGPLPSYADNVTNGLESGASSLADSALSRSSKVAKKADSVERSASANASVDGPSIV